MRVSFSAFCAFAEVPGRIDSWTPSNVSLRRRSSSGSSFMPRRRPSLLSTISSWPLTSPTVSLSLRASLLSLPPPHRTYFPFSPPFTQAPGPLPFRIFHKRLTTDDSSSFCMFRPQSLLTGMNRFLASLEITFRRDPTNFRPRVNKMNSVKDKEQKGTFRLFLHCP